MDERLDRELADFIDRCVVECNGNHVEALNRVAAFLVENRGALGLHATVAPDGPSQSGVDPDADARMADAIAKEVLDVLKEHALGRTSPVPPEELEMM